MKIKIRNWIFCPRLITTLLALTFFILFLRLGFWQLDRAAQKYDEFSFFETRQAKQAINLDQNNIKSLDSTELIWRKVKMTGSFLEERQILLDNQVNASTAGYYVYTPFLVKDSENVVLVNRGWVPSGANRSLAPDLVVTKGIVTIVGLVKKEPRTGLLLIKDHTEKLNETIMRMQRLNIEEVGNIIKINLSPLIVRLSPESDHGYIRKWKSRDSGKNTHIGYAYQWFAFAVTLLIIYLIMNTKREME